MIPAEPGKAPVPSLPPRDTPAVTDHTLLTRLTLRGALRVPEITVYFWVVKALSTGMGESTSDYLVRAMPPVAAVGLGFIGFAAALSLQFSAPLHGVDVLAGGGHGGCVRHDGCRWPRSMRWEPTW